MSWEQLIWFAAAATLCWITGAVLAFRSKRWWTAATASIAGSVIFFAYIVGMWIALERPPMRTMGETRLWYSFFLSIAGVAVFIRWRYKWILSFSTMMSVVFICVNLFKPESHSVYRPHLSSDSCNLRLPALILPCGIYSFHHPCMY